MLGLVRLVVTKHSLGWFCGARAKVQPFKTARYNRICWITKKADTLIATAGLRRGEGAT